MTAKIVSNNFNDNEYIPLIFKNVCSIRVHYILLFNDFKAIWKRKKIGDTIKGQ